MDRRRNSEVIVEALAELGGLGGWSVVDVGCGDGALARHLARQGARVLGVECSPRQLAKARLAEQIPGVAVVAAVGQALPVADGVMDVAVFFNSLHHIPIQHQWPALVEAARVLRPGGIVYISEPIAEGPFFEAVRPVDDETQVRAAAYAALQRASCFGLRPLREFSYVHTVLIGGYEAFRERIISANDEREERFRRQDAEMRALFGRLASPMPGGGFVFDQPMRINILRKV